MELIGKKIVVIGGGGLVGEGIVRQLLLLGAQVLATSRDAAKLEALKSAVNNHPQLFTRVADVATPLGAESLAHEADCVLGNLDAVVCAINAGPTSRPLCDLNDREWHASFTGSIHPHFFASQSFLSRLSPRPHGAYIMLSGNILKDPVRNNVPASINAAAQAMLTRGLILENRTEPVRIHTLMIGTPVIHRERPNGPMSWLTADEVGVMCAYLTMPRAEILRGQAVFEFVSRNQLEELGMTVRNPLERLPTIFEPHL
jgi:NAD(P)-dependent dehydrogenase (short-subunit alcohol dehydrogenase family)